MPHMVPATYRSTTNGSERRVFNALEGIVDRPDWVVFHSLVIRQHVDQLMGEADFVVVVPGRGIVVVEAKSPRSVSYNDGQWDLNGTPSPHKDPFTQIDGATRSIRQFLMARGAISGVEPFARLVWFTSIGRHHFSNRAPSHLGFFEWEMAWSDDLSSPAATIESVLDRTVEWYSKARHVQFDPSSLTTSAAKEIETTLRGDFTIQMDNHDAHIEAQLCEAQVLAEQRFALDLLETNRAVYFDGPAGSGKSYLLTQAATRAIRRNERTLVTCWNRAMAANFRESLGGLRGPMAVSDLGSLMLRVVGLSHHPEGASHSWYEEELPQLALKHLTSHPEFGGYRNIVVDEFQDIAGSQRLLDFLFALASPTAHFILAGDAHQQIMQSQPRQVDPHQTLKERLPDAVHARIRQNCRHSPTLVHEAEAIVGRPFGFTGYRMPSYTPGSANVVPTSKSSLASTLATVLKMLAQTYGNDDVVVLSPRGSHAAASLLLNAPTNSDDSADVRWLRANLGESEGRIRYGSISALKGIEVSAVVITDVGTESQEWAAHNQLNWQDLIYVAISRAKYRAVLLETRDMKKE